MTITERIARVLEDPAASSWLKACLRSALERDPVDAANDAEILNELLRDSAEDALGLSRGSDANTAPLPQTPTSAPALRIRTRHA